MVVVSGLLPYFSSDYDHWRFLLSDTHDHQATPDLDIYFLKKSVSHPDPQTTPPKIFPRFFPDPPQVQLFFSRGRLLDLFPLAGSPKAESEPRRFLPFQVTSSFIKLTTER